MSISKQPGVLRNLLPDRITPFDDAQPLFEHPAGQVWPIRRAVLFWVAVSTAGWIAFYGLTNHLT